MNSGDTSIRPLLARAFYLILLVMVVVFRWSPSLALLSGLLVGLTTGNPFPATGKLVTKYLLQASIVGLGFGINIRQVGEAGQEGFVFTLLSLAAAIGLGYLLGRMFKVEKVISYLISVGTAICGGSAIAAVSQVLDADDRDVSVSIGTVFILNAVALFIFPPIGHWAELSPQQFGIWAAIAIHDTSSVVGAAAAYGNESLVVATTIKLARALWIVPLALLTATVFRKKRSMASFPWFILFFVVASFAGTYLRLDSETTAGIVRLAKTGFGITLFIIGTGITRTALLQVGPRPMMLGIVLWAVIVVASLWVLRFY